eukprot:8894876-Pyramimonas_sp.AAC.1
MRCVAAGAAGPTWRSPQVMGLVAGPEADGDRADRGGAFDSVFEVAPGNHQVAPGPRPGHRALLRSARLRGHTRPGP